MVIPDVNLLLYAELAAFPLHKAARRWWEDLLNGERAVGIAPVCLFGFLRISTNRRVFTDPLPVGDAIARARRWLDQPQVRYLSPGSRHAELAFEILARVGTGANLTTDAQIAAHAIEYGGEVHSNDPDFARFEGVRWVNPLAA